MKRISLILTFVLLAFTIAPVQAGSLALTSAGVPLQQYLRMGSNLKSSPVYSNLTGRVASLTAEMQSATDKNVYFAFPAAAERRLVRSSAFYLLNRSGSYAGKATMTLEIYDAAGHLQHTTSAKIVNLQNAAPHIWLKLTLSSSATNCLLEPGEFLVFHLILDGAPGGNLVVNPLFEVTVGPQGLFLPLVTH